jgi:hypothetical protein
MVGALPSEGWPAWARRPCWEARPGGACLWWLVAPVWSGEPVWLVALGWLVAADGTGGWLMAVAWPGMAD